MDPRLTIRTATAADLPALKTIMDLAIEQLQSGFLSPEQVVASRAVMGLDTQLVTDGTDLVVEDCGTPVGCGGWSRRAMRPACGRCTPIPTTPGAESVAQFWTNAKRERVPRGSARSS